MLFLSQYVNEVNGHDPRVAPPAIYLAMPRVMAKVAVARPGLLPRPQAMSWCERGESGAQFRLGSTVAWEVLDAMPLH